MAHKTSRQKKGRARRFPLRLPLYFRELDSLTWLQGTTENISHTGMLFLSPSSLALESTLDLKVLLDVDEKGKDSAVALCKGVVIRQEQRKTQDPRVALAVVIQNFRISRQPFSVVTPVGNA